MTNLQKLIDTAYKLSANLEKSANEEKIFCINMQIRLEQMSLQMYKTANELKYIKESL